MVCEALRAYFSDANLALLRKLGVDTSGFARVRDAPADVEAAGFRFSAHAQAIEPILVERLGEPGLDIFEYLTHAHGRLGAEASKGWVAADSAAQELVREMGDTVRNYLGLAVSTPELFEGARFELKTRMFARVPAVGMDGCEKVRRLMQLSAELHNAEIVDAAVEALAGEGVQVCFLACYFLAQELKSHIVCSPELDDVLALCRLLLGNETFRAYVLANCDTGKLARGVEVETHTFLGALLTQSLLPYTRDPRLPEFEKRVADKVAACKTQNAYNKTVEVG